MILFYMLDTFNYLSSFFSEYFFCCLRAHANFRALMTQKSCAVGMRNAILRNHLKSFSLWQNTTCKTHAFQHCQHDTICSRVQIHACNTKLLSILTGDSTYISGNISSPLQCKEHFCDSVSFAIVHSSVQKCRMLFSNYFMFAKPLVYFLPYEREQEVHNCIHQKRFRGNSIKISNVVIKETSQILLPSLWHIQKLQINLVSL